MALSLSIGLFIIFHPNNLNNIYFIFAYFFLPIICHLQLTKRMNKRDPRVFHHILNFLRGQPPKIDSLDSNEIDQILDDAEVLFIIF